MAHIIEQNFTFYLSLVVLALSKFEALRLKGTHPVSSKQQLGGWCMDSSATWRIIICFETCYVKRSNKQNSGSQGHFAQDVKMEI
jgi:hypothetical protein